MRRGVIHQLLLFLAGRVAPLLARAFFGLVRVRVEGWEHVQACRRSGRAYILAFWHSRLLFMAHHPRFRNSVWMVNDNRLGDYTVRFIAAFGHAAVRGSETGRAVSGLRSLARKLREGWPAALTVDGPFGPVERVKGGAVQAAALTGAWILPLSFCSRPVWRLPSWERMMLPLGLGRGILLIGTPIEVPSRCPRAKLEEKSAELQRALDALTHRAEHYWDKRHVEVSQS